MSAHQVEVNSRTVGTSEGPQLSRVVLALFEEQITVAELIERSVEEQINDLINHRKLEMAAARRALDRQYLTQAEIDRQAQGTGAVRFPKKSEATVPDIIPENEVRRAIQAFSEGVYLIIVDGEQMQHLDQTITLGLNTKVTFLRLTPLVGG